MRHLLTTSYAIAAAHVSRAKAATQRAAGWTDRSAEFWAMIDMQHDEQARIAREIAEGEEP